MLEKPLAQIIGDVKSVDDLQNIILNNIEDIIYVSTPDSHELVYVNESFKQRWGSDVIGEKCYKILQNRDEPCPFCTNSIIFADENEEPMVWEFQNEITKQWYKCTDRVIRTSKGERVRFEIATDITSLKKAEQLLKESEAEYRMLFHSMNEGFAYHEVIYDTNNHPIDYIFRNVNPKFEKFTGLKKENILNKKVTECIPGIEKATPNLIEKYGLIARDGGDCSFELYFDPYDTWYNVSVFNPKRDFFCTIFEDITDKKYKDKKIQQTLDELKISNQELEQFAYVASHDLQEPLRMVASFTNLLQNKYADNIDDKGKMYMDYVIDGALRMQSLINDLLDFSRISTKGEKFSTCDSNIILGRAIANLKHTIEETRTIITNDELPTIKADENQLMRVFLNLISNAIKFRNESSSKIHVACRKNENNYEFSISDNGIGMDPKFKEKIFIIFQRLNTREEYPGTGIGLAICKRIINRHKGNIWVESEIAKGSTFYFTIPL